MLYLRYMAIILVILFLWSTSSMARSHGPHREPAWTETLTEDQREHAQAIVDEAAPTLRELRIQLRDKMKELKEFAYSKAEDHEALPRLGRELQLLREQLLQAWNALDKKLMREVGISIKPYRGRSCAGLYKHSLHGESLGYGMEPPAPPHNVPVEKQHE